MAFRFVPDVIVRLEGRKCIVIPPGEKAEIDYMRIPLVVVSCGAGCIFTEDGYAIGDGPLWVGAARERMHPWPQDGAVVFCQS